jgi:branched-chain amino acid transport system permease protein
LLQQLIANGIIAGSIYALVALGFNVIYRTVRFFHFAHGVIYTVGAYSAYVFIVLWGFDLISGFFLPVS